MKIIAGLIASTFAQAPGVLMERPWPGNQNAPHCGCNFHLDPRELTQSWDYINSTCSLNFKYPSKVSGDTNDPHFVSVASSYMVGRDRTDEGTIGSQFQFTGYDEVSNPDLLDILVFYEQDQCCAEGKDCVNTDFDAPDFDQSTVWEYFNLTNLDALCEFELVCDNSGAVPGVHLGNFNYDIARSVQTYTVPIYGLEKGEEATVTLLDYNGDQNNCMNALAHHGHGTAEGCSTNSTDGCSNVLSFKHDQDHNGLLEYFQFEPVSPVNNPICFALPTHHVDDYQWQTPSPWDTQEAGIAITEL